MPSDLLPVLGLQLLRIDRQCPDPFAGCRVDRIADRGCGRRHARFADAARQTRVFGEMDVLGIAFSEFTDADREAVVRAHPRPGRFKEEIIQAFYDGIHRKPETTFGNVKADVLADKDPSFRPENFCRVIRASAWSG